MPWGRVRTPSYGDERVRYAPGHILLSAGLKSRVLRRYGGDSMFQCCLVGGTFDRFHAGHRALLAAGLARSAHVEVWVSDEEMAQGKDPRIESLDERMAAIQGWVHGFGFADKVSVHVLTDNWGPAPSHATADAILATEETAPNCIRINEMRAEAGLAPLEILLVGHVPAGDGAPISSSRIRAGVIDGEGEVWLRPEDLASAVRMAPALDAELKTPMGTLFSGPEEDPTVAMRAVLEVIPETCPCLITVGDVTTVTLQQIGEVPDLALVDGMTKRQTWEGASRLDEDDFAGVAHAVNPAGQLTPELIRAADECLEFAFAEDGGPVLLRVDGEEDLAPIILHLLAPLGTAILYGQPGEGVVLRFTDEDAKARCRRMLDLFEAI